MALAEVKQEELNFVRGVGGYFNLTEFDQGINDIQRKKIEAFKQANGTCFLGKINYYGEERKNIDSQEILIPYTGQMVYNFEYDFMVSGHDEKLVELIKDLNRPKGNLSEVKKQVGVIIGRIEELNSEYLTWV